MIAVYGIWDPITDEEYVGSSIKIEYRKRLHKYGLKRGTHHSRKLQNSFNKGTKFKFRILEKINSKDYRKNPSILVKREQYYINTIPKGKLLNGSKFADNPMRDPKIAARVAKALKGHKVSPETRAKISKSLTGRKGSEKNIETRAKLSRALTGKKRKPFSKEWRANLSAAARGRKTSEETKMKIGAANRGRKRSNEVRAKISAAMKNPSTKVRANLSAGQRRRWKRWRMENLK